jgi:hypothetical protein
MLVYPLRHLTTAWLLVFTSTGHAAPKDPPT